MYDEITNVFFFKHSLLRVDVSVFDLTCMSQVNLVMKYWLYYIPTMFSYQCKFW